MFKAKARPTVTVRAVITRADGRVEDMGVISRSPAPNALLKLIRKVTKNG